jgi:hypothetical protein
MSDGEAMRAEPSVTMESSVMMEHSSSWFPRPKPCLSAQDRPVRNGRILSTVVDYIPVSGL